MRNTSFKKVSSLILLVVVFHYTRSEDLIIHANDIVLRCSECNIGRDTG